MPRNPSEGVVNDVVGDGCGVGFRVVNGQVADGIEMIRQRPEDLAGSVGLNLLVGQDLVDDRAPEVAVRDLTFAVDLQNNLTNPLPLQEEGTRSLAPVQCPGASLEY